MWINTETAEGGILEMSQLVVFGTPSNPGANGVAVARGEASFFRLASAAPEPLANRAATLSCWFPDPWERPRARTWCPSSGLRMKTGRARSSRIPRR